ncbi:hypothetical protein CYLTODRAFT_434646 [Cylindrobasidium torrendii FP15055 ss-10]|uniref:G domain-containing protein n=1 Tax=Cylindrobasidium torrendii FP15055 ss-10 TaxID=1314674 RepID=A0A0D7BRD1_9AGAR|nr:hypothetical protein CYLTODRAFT_434646 [Cylindrobasidium torrendii FP15055 ss-10]
MALRNIPVPSLPVPPTWFPGHMNKFTRQLPSLLPRTHIVLEVRDSRLPLTSINRSLQEELRNWREKQRVHNNPICRHIVLLNKSDRVPSWGVSPFLSLMEEKYPDQEFVFTCLRDVKDTKKVYKMLADIGKGYPRLEAINVLIVGMPNIGKSTLLNGLRNQGIKGPTPKAVRTGPQPGLTQALSNRVKITESPPTYAFDTPGMMLPFLGHGPSGAERGAKLALIAGIKEGLYQSESLAEYLLYKLNVLNPSTPTYLSILPAGSSPTTNLDEFLTLLAKRMGMIVSGGHYDLQRAATFFVDWWRKKDGVSDSADADADAAFGWGFDFQWPVERQGADIRTLMEECHRNFEDHVETEEREGGMISDAQKEKKIKEERGQARLEKLARQGINPRKSSSTSSKRGSKRR